jgi:Aminoglycoside 3-N-acetyltransferase
LGSPLATVTLVHHVEAVAQVPGKRRVSYGIPVIVGGERRWRSFSDIDTAEGALPYERVLGEEEDYVEHIARSALAAGTGRSGPPREDHGPPVRRAGAGKAGGRLDRAELCLRGPRRAVSKSRFKRRSGTAIYDDLRPPPPLLRRVRGAPWPR